MEYFVDGSLIKPGWKDWPDAPGVWYSVPGHQYNRVMLNADGELCFIDAFYLTITDAKAEAEYEFRHYGPLPFIPNESGDAQA